MNQIEESKVLFREVMEANSFIIKESANHLTIKKGKKGEAQYNTKLIFLALGLIVGFLVFLFSKRYGTAILVTVGGILFSLMNKGEREKEGANKTLIVNQDQIEIKEGTYKSKRIKISDIAEFETDTYPFGEKFIGKIAIVTEDKKSFEFLELFGDNEEVLEGDLLIIAQYLVDVYFPK